MLGTLGWLLSSPAPRVPGWGRGQGHTRAGPDGTRVGDRVPPIPPPNTEHPHPRRQLWVGADGDPPAPQPPAAQPCQGGGTQGIFSPLYPSDRMTTCSADHCEVDPPRLGGVIPHGHPPGLGRGLLLPSQEAMGDRTPILRAMVCLGPRCQRLWVPRTTTLRAVGAQHPSVQEIGVLRTPMLGLWGAWDPHTQVPEGARGCLSLPHQAPSVPSPGFR